MAQGALGCRDKAPFMLFIETLGQADPPPVPEPFSRQNSGLEAGTQEFSCICRQAGLPAAGPACGRSAVLILQLHDAPPPPPSSAELHKQQAQVRPKSLLRSMRLGVWRGALRAKVLHLHSLPLLQPVQTLHPRVRALHAHA